MKPADLDVGRREMVTTLLGLGALGLAGCAGEEERAPPATGTVAEAIWGPEQLVVVAPGSKMKTLPVPPNPNGHSICYLAEPGLEGVWKLTPGNFANEIGIDADQGIYLASSNVPPTQAAW